MKILNTLGGAFYSHLSDRRTQISKKSSGHLGERGAQGMLGERKNSVWKAGHRREQTVCLARRLGVGWPCAGLAHSTRETLGLRTWRVRRRGPPPGYFL